MGIFGRPDEWGWVSDHGDGSELGMYIFFSHSWPFMSPHGFIALKFMGNGVPKWSVQDSEA